MSIIDMVARRLHDRDRKLMLQVPFEHRPASWDVALRDFDNLPAVTQEEYFVAAKHDFKMLDVSLPALLEDRDTVSHMLQHLQQYILDAETHTDKTIRALEDSKSKLEQEVSKIETDVKNMFSGLLTPEAFNKRMGHA